jgi:hypothetical protein
MRNHQPYYDGAQIGNSKAWVKPLDANGNVQWNEELRLATFEPEVKKGRDITIPVVLVILAIIIAVAFLALHK